MNVKAIYGIASICLILLCSTNAIAQFTVSGNVYDANTNERLIGVNIFDTQNQVGVSTDLNGEYSLEIEQGTTSLRVSYVGYLTQTISVSGNNGETVELNIELVSDVANLDELVVTGLATSVKRSNIANSVSSLNAEDISGKTDTPTLDAALQGKIPGVQINSYSGAPGGGFNVQLRGVSTLGAGSSQPLYIIDGVYLDNSFISTGRSSAIGAGGSSQDDTSNRLADLNPDDIESIEVLKGASAAAIYGQRANAGVIIIKTKQGKAGSTKVSFSQDIGYSSALKLLGRTNNWTNDRIDLVYSTPQRRATEYQRLADAQANGGIRDLEEIFYGNSGLLTNTQISVSGGNESTQFYISGGVKDEDGIIKNTGFNRSSLRANIQHQINQRISVTSNSNYIQSDSDRGFTGNQNNTGSSLGYALSAIPNYAYGILKQNEDGSFPDNPYFAENPFRLIEVAENNQKVNRFIQSLSLNAELITNDSYSLVLRGQGGFDYLNSNSMIYLPEFMQYQRSQPFPGSVTNSMQEVINTNLQASLILNASLSSNIYSTTQAGFSRFTRNSELERINGTGLLPGQTNVGNASQVSATEFFLETKDVGVFGQQELNWDDRVIATIGARLDKSTLNFKQDEFYLYPKASLAVNIANFDFWNVEEMSQLKLRAAYGETGGLPSFGEIFNSLGNTNIGDNVGATASTTSVDPELTPERAKELEFGLDLSLFNGRVSFDGTYYIKTVDDLILALNPAPSTGVSDVLTNAATLENKGIELGLSVIPVRNERFSWESRVNWWTNKSEITDLLIPEQNNNLLGFIGFGATRYAEGVSPTAIFGIPTLSNGDLTEFGDFQPDFQMSWKNDFAFLKDFDLSFLWHWSSGAENINLSEFLTDGSGNSPDFFDDNNNVTDRVAQGFSTTERFLQDASYIKLREASLYYTMSDEFLQNIVGDNISNIRLGVSGSNLFMISNYDGYDPEVNFSGRSTLAQSLAITPFPSSRKIMFHLNFDF